jgi:hypothetical protein
VLGRVREPREQLIRKVLRARRGLVRRVRARHAQAREVSASNPHEREKKRRVAVVHRLRERARHLRLRAGPLQRSEKQTARGAGSDVARLAVGDAGERTGDEAMDELLDALLDGGRILLRLLRQGTERGSSLGAVPEEPLVRVLGGRGPVLVPSVRWFVCLMVSETETIGR